MSPSSSRYELSAAVSSTLVDALARAEGACDPFPHWIVRDLMPEGLTAELRKLPFPPPGLDGVSGKRELHNDQRHYFDAVNNDRFDVCGAVADAFQSSEVVRAIEARTGSDLAGTFVRLEYAQDTDGFWLEPHTDLGVKRFTMLMYLADSADQSDLGTDVYRDPRTWAKRPPFIDNTALVFVPGSNTWHGMSPRSITGVRRSVIMNYVTDEWRARDQLAYPDTPVLA